MDAIIRKQFLLTSWTSTWSLVHTTIDEDNGDDVDNEEDVDDDNDEVDDEDEDVQELG